MADHVHVAHGVAWLVFIELGVALLRLELVLKSVADVLLWLLMIVVDLPLRSTLCIGCSWSDSKAISDTWQWCKLDAISLH